MTLTVLVPLDGSPLAETALPFATHLVADGRGRLVIAHVRTPRPANRATTTDFDPEANALTLRADGLPVLSCVLTAADGDVAAAIHAAALDQRADLIVMSTHGRGGLRRSIFGSVADQLIRRAELPVLLVPAQCAQSWQERRPTQLLVPLDGSPLAEAALAPAAALARLLDAELLLVRALSPRLHTRYRDGKLVLSSADFVEVDDAWTYLSRVADDLRADGLRASIWVLVGGPAPAIAEAARAEQVDLIVMTTHGRGGLGRMLLGSVADGVLQRASVPVVLVRSAATSGAVENGVPSTEARAGGAADPTQTGVSAATG